jgi:anti-anti-sigma factor
MAPERDQDRVSEYVVVTVREDDHELAVLRWQLHDALLAGARTVVVDVSEQPCLSSNAMAALLGAYRACRARGGELVLCGCSRATTDVLVRTGLHRVFRTERTLRAWFAGGGAGRGPGSGEQLSRMAAS